MRRSVFAGVVLAATLVGAALVAVGPRSAPKEVAPASSPSSSAFASPGGAAASVASRRPDTSVWKVPVYADDPVKGPNDALVTLVAFSDFQSPPAKRAAKVLDQLLAEYPNDLRIVWKDDPLPFNPRARPAALFARLVYQKAGQGGFWRAHDLLFEGQSKLEDADLELAAKQLGVAWSDANPQSATRSARAKVDQSIELARDIEARGTPHFFINGVRLPGAQPIEKFRARVQVEMAAARVNLSKGITRQGLYASIIEQGRQLPALERGHVPSPASTSPSMGAVNANVVLQYWSEFPCETCARTMFRLYELEKEYASDLRIVWRSTAAPSRAAAFSAAAAAREALSQKGNAAFWTFHNRVLEAQGAPNGLEAGSLQTIARDVGLDFSHFKSAVETGKHAAALTADVRAAEAAGISVSPTFTVNGYHLGSNPDLSQFRRAIQRALREAGGR
jgi:protein-disulfide isomerase